MKVGIPREIKNHEYRVAISPAGVHELVGRGHEVVIETGAGVGSSFSDEDFKAAGAQILGSADQVWTDADLLLKVKEPIAEEYSRLRKDQVLFTYLHLAASKECTDALLTSKTTSIAYETVVGSDGSLPLLAPMSEVAGRLAPQAGAYHLMRHGGGRGVLMGGVPGVRPAKVVVIGAGVSGKNAIAVAYGMQADVTVLDLSIARLREIDELYHGQVKTITSNSLELEQGCTPTPTWSSAQCWSQGRKAPTLVSNSLVARIETGFCPGRHRHRSGRLLRGFARDHARRSDVPGTRFGLLLALPTCPEPSPVRPPTHSPTRRFRTSSHWPTRGGRTRVATDSRGLGSGLSTHDGLLLSDSVAAAHGVLGYHSLTQAALTQAALTQATKARDR